LQMARNVAMLPDHYAFYISFEHSETHLLDRLICLESIDPTSDEYQRGLRMNELRSVVLSQLGRIGANEKSGLYKILQSNPLTTRSLEMLRRYANRLLVMKANASRTSLKIIEYLAQQLVTAAGGNVVIFVDYLQKVNIHPQRSIDENDKVTIIAEGLKDLATSLNIPVVSIVAADREGLKAKRLHLHHLRGSSALDYECDIAVIMNNKFRILSKTHLEFNLYKAESYRDWVVFTLEKNRAGRAMIDLEFQLRAEHFCFNTRGNVVEQKLIDEKIIAE
jgi:replicative DNA helicase